MWIRKQMQRRDWSGADLARELDMSPSRVSDWINGKFVPNVQSARRLAEAFGADADDVLALAGHREPTAVIPADAPQARIIALVKRVKWTEDRARPLEKQLQEWIIIDREIAAAAP
ncbi:MAG: helix-turn-helix transcriptional regulator [Thermomicrobiales bacterium]